MSDALLRRLIAVGLIVAAIAGAGAHSLRHLPSGADRVRPLIGADAASVQRRITVAPAGLAIALTPAERSLLQQSIARNPIDGMAFALAGFDATGRGDARKAQLLIDHAITLEPRTALAWAWRLDRQLRSPHPENAVATVLRLLAIDPEHYQSYIPVLAVLAQRQASHPAIAAALNRNPPWGPPLLDLLAQSNLDPKMRFALLSRVGNNLRTVDNDRQSLISQLIAKGDFDRAYLAWVTFLPADAIGSVETPYDPGFKGLKGPAPFNWQLETGGSDRVSIEANGLTFSYSGEGPSVLAQETMLLAPGVYRLRTDVGRSDEDAAPSLNDSSAVAWQVACLPAGKIVAEVPIALHRPGRQLSPAFRIDASGCGAVSLRLRGSSSGPAIRLAGVIAGIHIDRVSDRVSVPAVAPPEGEAP